jgi:hypothetical protein
MLVGVDDELSNCAARELLDITIAEDRVAGATLLLPMDDTLS